MTGAVDPVTAHRLKVLEDSHHDIAESLKALVRLEQHHADTRLTLERALQEQAATRERIQALADQIPDRLDERLVSIEREMPTLKLTSGWVVSFTLGGFALMALLVWSATNDRHDHATIPPDRRVTIEQEKAAP